MDDWRTFETVAPVSEIVRSHIEVRGSRLHLARPTEFAELYDGAQTRRNQSIQTLLSILKRFVRKLKIQYRYQNCFKKIFG